MREDQEELLSIGCSRGNPLSDRKEKKERGKHSQWKSPQRLQAGKSVAGWGGGPQANHHGCTSGRHNPQNQLVSNNRAGNVGLSPLPPVQSVLTTVPVPLSRIEAQGRNAFEDPSDRVCR